MQLWDSDFRLKNGRKQSGNVKRNFASATVWSHQQPRR